MTSRAGATSTFLPGRPHMVDLAHRMRAPIYGRATRTGYFETKWGGSRRQRPSLPRAGAHVLDPTKPYIGQGIRFAGDCYCPTALTSDRLRGGL